MHVNVGKETGVRASPGRRGRRGTGGCSRHCSNFHEAAAQGLHTQRSPLLLAAFPVQHPLALPHTTRQFFLDMLADHNEADYGSSRPVLMSRRHPLALPESARQLC